MTPLREKIHAMAANNPNMKRSHIANECKCSPALVTKTLGASKAYKPRQAKQVNQEPV